MLANKSGDANISASRHKLFIAALLVLVMSVLLFARLGRYHLWDDEANTALFAKSVWRTGDTYAMIGHNIVAYGGGRELENLRNRYMPPLSYYLAAPFLGLFGDSTFAARFPFAVCGLLTVGVIILWLRKDKAEVRTWWLMAIAIIGNVSMMLYSRQSRYYAPAMLFSTLVAYFYVHWDGRRRTMLCLILSSLMLLASNYMSYAALHFCMLADYLLWHRKQHAVKIKDWAIYLSAQIVVGGLLIWIYMPHKETGIELFSAIWFKTKAIMFLRSFRDLNRCEFGVLVLILAAPILSLIVRNRWLLRAFVAVLLYSLFVGIAAPETLYYKTAPMRMYSPVIPLYIGLGVLSLAALTRRIPKISIPLALVIFLTNVAHGGPVFKEGFRSTLAAYVGELVNPPPSAYGVAADWINKNVKDGASIWVSPFYAPYPLMFHAPKAVYAWQLSEQARVGQFALLPLIHFSGRALPDYIIVFGPEVRQVRRFLITAMPKGVSYSQTTLNIYWELGVQSTRPELYWHKFKAINDFDRDTEAVYIFRRVRP